MDRSLLIGPANYAGQAFEWARAAEEHLGVRARCLASARIPGTSAATFNFPSDEKLSVLATLGYGGGRAFRRRAQTFSHIAIDGFMSPVRRHGDLRRAIELLEDRGTPTALIAHGSEVRDPDSHRDRYDFSFFREAPPEWVDELRAKTAANRALLAQNSLPVFVSTPDLALDVAGATWLPLTVRVGAWQQPSRVRRSRLRFLHLPSWRNPPIKGTAHIDPVLRRLASEGLIEYLAPEAVAHASMPSLLAGVDIVVDQIMTGSYGVAAVEAMAAGRAVIGNVSDDVRALMPEQPPIIDATPFTLEDVVRRLVAAPERYESAAAEGPGFVSRWHDGAAAARSLADFVARPAGRR